jgi:hypothetical protein
MAESTLVYLSATFSFVFLCVGVFAGWTVNEKYHEYMYATQQENVHPEMLNEEGQWINEELLSVRFLKDDDDEDYDD